MCILINLCNVNNGFVEFLKIKKINRFMHKFLLDYLPSFRIN